jgi:hypothetical protein
MTLQTQELVMLGLGIKDDRLGGLQPSELRNGIHLRWAFKRNLGFPYYGFYLFRRHHQEKTKSTCVGNIINSLENIGKSNLLNLDIGQFSSDNTLSLVFALGPSATIRGFDLRNRQYLRFSLPTGKYAYKIKLDIQFFQQTKINVIALLEDVPVAHSIITGRAYNVESTLLEFDKISAIEISGGEALLMELCFTQVEQDATVGWERLPNFTYPMCLPVTYPDYACNAGTTTEEVSEDLSASRELAKNRIKYGNPDQFVRISQIIQTSTGTISVVNGSAIVIGTNTSWDKNITGFMLQVDKDITAYTIMNVISPNKLVLSRNYNGASNRNMSYIVSQDPFGQMHDYLIHLISQGPNAEPMAERLVPQPVNTAGTISVNNGSPEVIGDNQTSWGDELIGLSFQVKGDNITYTIAHVTSSNIIILDRRYIGRSLTNAQYRIFAKIGSTESSEIGVAATAATTTAPLMPQQSPLDLILLAALNPAISQMLGLYCVDEDVQEGEAYDYLILADYVNFLEGNADLALRDEDHIKDCLDSSFKGVKGYIVFNKKLELAPELSSPENLRVYALPSIKTTINSTTLTKQKEDTENNIAGLVWDRCISASGILLPNQAIMYHIWRSYLGNGGSPTPETNYTPITDNMPVLVVRPQQFDSNKKLQHPEDWPPFPMYFIDQGLKDGWYSYQVSGIDIFGRHSRNSTRAQWYQWRPIPDPRPWYYNEFSIDNVVNPVAVRLLDKTPPPPPAGVEAYVLDPRDPTVLRDANYNAWRSSHPNVVGLRVLWHWNQAHVAQAPDTAEFRIYYHAGHMNELAGKVTSIYAITTQTCDIETDISNVQPVNAYSGASIRIGIDTFKIESNESESPLKLRIRRNFDPVYVSGTIAVENGSQMVTGSGTSWDARKLTNTTLQIAGELDQYLIVSVNSPTQLKLDRAYSEITNNEKKYAIINGLPNININNKECTITIPSIITEGTIAVNTNSPFITGKGTNWNAETIGWKLKLTGESSEYTIIGIDSPTHLRINRNYEGITDTEKIYTISHPLFIDNSLPASWQQRCFVVDYNNDRYVTETIYPARGVNGDELRGNEGRISGSVVSLNGNPDLSGITIGREQEQMFIPYLYLENDTSTQQKMYRIIAIDNNTKQVLLEGSPNIGSLPSSSWVIGWPVRVYEVFMPCPEANGSQSFVPSLANPIVYAHIGVTSVDNQTNTPDNPKWDNSDLGRRDGNESSIGSSATIYRVLREEPPIPQILQTTSERLYASAADYNGHSFFTYRWNPLSHLKIHIYRAMDDALFKLDWLIRTTRAHLDAEDIQHLKFFPSEWGNNAQRKRNAAVELNAISSSSDYGRLSSDALVVLARLPGNQHAKPGNELQERDWTIRRSRRNLLDSNTIYFPIEWRGSNSEERRRNIAMRLSNITSFDMYDSLSDDSLRVLAGLPGNEAAFNQLTTQPLDPEERDPDNPQLLRWRDKIGPDGVMSYNVQPLLRSYVDMLDGNSNNCYFYRSAYIDAAHNYSRMSLCTPPVYVPLKIRPQTPVITTIIGGDRQITIRWVFNREDAISEYNIYRCDNPNDSRDIRLMTLVHRQILSDQTYVNSPSSMSWTDSTVAANIDFSYRVVSKDYHGNVSLPSSVISGRCFDYGPPVEPIWERSEWVKLDINGIENNWNNPRADLIPAISLIFTTPQKNISALIQGRINGIWQNISQWLRDPVFDSNFKVWRFTMHDKGAQPHLIQYYRVRLTNLAGITRVSEQRIVSIP